MKTYHVWHLTDLREEWERHTSHNYPLLDTRRDSKAAKTLFLAPLSGMAYIEVAEVAGAALTLEDVFRLTSHIATDWTTNTEVVAKRRDVRSTSVGDIVVDQEGNGWLCSAFGWEALGLMQKDVQFFSIQNLAHALKSSLRMIQQGSALRVAVFASQLPNGETKVVPMDSSECSGRDQGKLAHGILIGVPA